MNLLTIAIPTYNRNIGLEKLLSSLSVVDLEALNIVVNIHDNSSREMQELNQKAALKNPCFNYFPNSSNIGYANNIIKSVASANSHYLWLLSDDDEVQTSCFAEITQILNSQSPLLLFLPFVTSANPGKIRNSNGLDGKNITELLDNPKLFPFALLSGFIVKISSLTDSSQLKIKSLFNKYSSNVFLQALVPLFLLSQSINTNSESNSISAYHDNVIFYKNSFEVRFSIYEMYKSSLSIEELAFKLNLIDSSLYRRRRRSRNSQYSLALLRQKAGLNSFIQDSRIFRLILFNAIRLGDSICLIKLSFLCLPVSLLRKFLLSRGHISHA